MSVTLAFTTVTDNCHPHLLQGLDWADHQTDCFSLSPLFYPEDEAPCGSRSLIELVSGGLEDEFELAATLARTPLKTPSRYVPVSHYGIYSGQLVAVAAALT